MADPVRKRKVSAFMARGRDLLVFRQPDFPAAGVQMPAGSIEPGEAPLDAAMRKAERKPATPGFGWLV